MMSMACYNIEFGCFPKCISPGDCARGMMMPTRTVHGGGYKGRKLWCCQREIGKRPMPNKGTRNVLMKTYVRVGARSVSFLDLDRESRSPASLANLFQVVAQDLQTLNKNLQSIVGAESRVFQSIVEQIFEVNGKQMRPGLVFLVSRATAEIVGLKELTKEHRQYAEIIEMIHTASMMHDDASDESDVRRVLVGDYILAQSWWYLTNLENLEVMKLVVQAMKDSPSGEIKQETNLFNCDVGLEEYLLRSHTKTASLVAASTKGAAIFNGVDGEICEHMYEYGKNFGQSFQVVNDILDFYPSTEGKSFGSELAKGTLTAPVIFGLQKEAKLRNIIESKFCESGSLEEAIEIINDCGGIDKARELAKTKADIALENLGCLPSSPFKFTLEETVRYNLNRIE